MKKCERERGFKWWGNWTSLTALSLSVSWFSHSLAHLLTFRDVSHDQVSVILRESHSWYPMVPFTTLPSRSSFVTQTLPLTCDLEGLLDSFCLPQSNLFFFSLPSFLSPSPDSHFSALWLAREMVSRGFVLFFVVSLPYSSSVCECFQRVVTFRNVFLMV